MELISVSMQRFKETIYPEYLKLFPVPEQKPYETIEKSVINKITDIIEIVVDNTFVGFIIVNTIKNNPYAQLDYLAILPNYQHKGYGTQAILLLKEKYKEYEGIFIEVEKVGLGETDEENNIRQKRANFYERIGFKKLDFDLNLFNVIYSAYMLPCLVDNFLRDEVIESIFEIYNAIAGEDRIKKYCSVII